MDEILLVEDEKELGKVTKDYLEKKGYRVKTVEDGFEALEYLKSNSVKLLILDIMLPNVDGLTICENVRGTSNIPIIIVSAKSGEDARILGRELGADDYIEKPYSIKELHVRIKTQLRRVYKMQEQLEFITDGKLKIDLSGRKAFLDERELNLATKEFDLLRILVENKGRALPKDRLFNMIWGMYSESEQSTLTVHINKIREKIEKNPKKPELIVTVWGVGYRYEGF